MTAKRFIEVFQGAKPIESFDYDLYFKVVEKITVYEDRLIVSLLDGTEIECENE